MKIEFINLADLKPLEKNVRKHSEKQIEELVRSLYQFGQTRAIIVDEDNNILIGNGLYIAMKKRGDTSAECSRIKGLTETQKKKLILSDNRIYSLGADDYANIEDFINEISLDGDFDIAGFDEAVIKEMTRELDEVNNDVKSYGNIPDGYIKPQESVSDVAETQHEGETIPAPVASAAAETMQPTRAETRRSVICPSCGEVIYLD